MTSNTMKAEDAIAKLRARAAEHEASNSEEYREYAAGIRDAIAALEPFIGATQTALPTREHVERVVSSYAVAPMLVDELMHLLGSGNRGRDAGQNDNRAAN